MGETRFGDVSGLCQSRIDNIPFTTRSWALGSFWNAFGCCRLKRYDDDADTGGLIQMCGFILTVWLVGGFQEATF